jgi:hypothetical protein
VASPVGRIRRVQARYGEAYQRTSGVASRGRSDDSDEADAANQRCGRKVQRTRQGTSSESAA